MTDYSSSFSGSGTRPEAEATTEDLTRDIGAIREDVSRLSDSVATLVRSQAEESAARMRDAFSVASGTLSEAAGSFARAGSGLASDAQVRFNTLGNELRTCIHRNPISSIVLAALFGMVFGALRRRH